MNQCWKLIHLAVRADKSKSQCIQIIRIETQIGIDDSLLGGRASTSGGQSWPPQWCSSYLAMLGRTGEEEWSKGVRISTPKLVYAQHVLKFRISNKDHPPFLMKQNPSGQRFSFCSLRPSSDWMRPVHIIKTDPNTYSESNDLDISHVCKLLS